MPGLERYCKKCGYEICNEGDSITWYHGKKTCECDSQSNVKENKQ